MEELTITNKENGVSVTLDVEWWEEILKLSYKRSEKSCFIVLKNITEKLEQKNFRMKRVNYKEKIYRD